MYNVSWVTHSHLCISGLTIMHWGRNEEEGKLKGVFACFTSAPWRATPPTARTPYVMPNALIERKVTIFTFLSHYKQNKLSLIACQTVFFLFRDIYLTRHSYNNAKTFEEHRPSSVIPSALAQKSSPLLKIKSLFWANPPSVRISLLKDRDFLRGDGEKEEDTPWHTLTSVVLMGWSRGESAAYSQTQAPKLDWKLRDQWAGPRRVDLASLHSNQGPFVYAWTGPSETLRAWVCVYVCVSSRKHVS